MERSLIGIESEDREWIQAKAARTGQSMSQIVRTAVRMMREGEEKSFEGLLNQTRGVWKSGEAMDYQRDIRAEWDSKAS